MRKVQAHSIHGKLIYFPAKEKKKKRFERVSYPAPPSPMLAQDSISWAFDLRVNP